VLEMTDQLTKSIRRIRSICYVLERLLLWTVDLYEHFVPYPFNMNQQDAVFSINLFQ